MNSGRFPISIKLFKLMKDTNTKSLSKSRVPKASGGNSKNAYYSNGNVDKEM